MAIQVSGIISGLDTDSIISQLVEIDARRRTKFEEDKQKIQDMKDLVGNFNSQLLTFKAEADNMLLSSTFQKRSASSNDTTVVSATASDGAAPGTYAILIDRLATQSTNTSAAKINLSQGKRSTASVSPGTSPIDLTQTFANAGFASTLDTATTVTITTNGGADTYNSAALSTYASVQAFINEVNADAAGINIWYDSVTDRFNVERKNAAAANTIDLDDSGADSFWDAVNIDEDAATGTETGLNAAAVLTALNTDTAITTNGTLTINGVGIAYAVATDTLSGLIQKINNQQATTGVTAFYDQTLDRVVLSRTTEGPETITVTDSNGAGGVRTGLKLTAATTLGSTALFSINGNSIQSDKNTYTFNGVTLNLNKQGDADGVVEATDASATVTVTTDTSSVATSVTNFVNSYNGVIDFLKENASFDPETLTAGPLFGDSTVRSVDARLKKLLIQPQPNLVDTHEILSQIGITLGKFNTEDAGKLIIDDTALNAAISANPLAVEALFGSITSGSTKNAGIGFDISSYINSLTKSKGIIDIKEENLDDRIEDIDDRIAREDARLERIEASLRRRFTSMESAMAILNSQGASLNQQLSRL
ncbi:flagellar filament capping protein FliD [bacterium]|nr:flagellar filament capping protein FliD [bacterium]